MNVAKLIQQRQAQWSELEQLCDAMQTSGKLAKTGKSEHVGGGGVVRFATLYRAACADLALADAYQLPPSTVSYLHRLVARSHNQMYRSRRMSVEKILDTLFVQAPREIFADLCVRVSAILFFGSFIISVALAANEDLFVEGYSEMIVGREQLDQVEEMYEQPLAGSLNHYVSMSAFYIWNNAGIGLSCFGMGILLIPCFLRLWYNGILLGAVFGYMSRDDVSGSENFFHFVTAHGPFELTAIVLAAGAGFKLGVGLFWTNGYRRLDSVRLAAKNAVPVISASVTLFVLAAFTEGFISPSPLPYLFKCGWAIMSSGLISFYFVVLGFPREEFSRLLAPRDE